VWAAVESLFLTEIINLRKSELLAPPHERPPNVTGRPARRPSPTATLSMHCPLVVSVRDRGILCVLVVRKAEVDIKKPKH